MAMLFELRKDLETAADLVNQIEIIRSQLAGITTLLDPGSAATPAAASLSSGEFGAIKKAADELDKKLIDVEENLIQRRLTGQGQDTARWPPKLISKINYLANGIGSGDFQPTSQHREVYALLKAQLTTQRSKLDEVVSKDLDAFNKLLRDRGIQNVVPRLGQ
jgi:hypothetical protein